jgi:hypothetical protein
LIKFAVFGPARPKPEAAGLTTGRLAALRLRLDKVRYLGGIEGMVLLRHTQLVRFLFAALIGVALMLNGMGRVLATTGNDGAGNTVVIAGTIITLCQFGKDSGAGDKIHSGHACDQCALRFTPLLPPADGIARLTRFPLLLRARPPFFQAAMTRLAVGVIWPRGPPLT